MNRLLVKDHLEFAQRSVNSLVEIVDVLRKDDYSSNFHDLSLEAARAVKCVFDRLAWSDGSVSAIEMQQLQNMLDVHSWLWNAYLQVEEAEPSSVGINTIPNLIFIAKDYDERHKSHHAHRLVNALEMIGFGVISADGDASQEEKDAFRNYISTFRTIILPESKQQFSHSLALDW
jgi:hypothetical protein